MDPLPGYDAWKTAAPDLFDSEHIYSDDDHAEEAVRSAEIREYLFFAERDFVRQVYEHDEPIEVPRAIY